MSQRDWITEGGPMKTDLSHHLVTAKLANRRWANEDGSQVEGAEDPEQCRRGRRAAHYISLLFDLN